MLPVSANALFKAILAAKVRLVFISLAGCLGTQNGERVEIDLMSRVPPAKIYVHEVIHFLYPGMTENQVRFFEGWLWEHLNQKQREKLYRKMFGRTS